MLAETFGGKKVEHGAYCAYSSAVISKSRVEPLAGFRQICGLDRRPFSDLMLRVGGRLKKSSLPALPLNLPRKEAGENSSKRARLHVGC